MRYLFAVAVAAVTVWAFMLPDGAGFARPELAKLLMWHLPCPFLAVILLGQGAWFSFKAMRTQAQEWDIRAVASMELGYLFCILTMLTGILFSGAQWGAWWSNDPRQTSFLLVLMIYAAYFALRGALKDETKRMAHSGAYALAALLPALFLIFVFPRLPQLAGLHPNDTISGGNLKGQFLYCFLAMMTVVSVLTAWLYRLRVRTGLLELKLEEERHGLENHLGDSSGPAVVRPVRVSREG